MRAPKAREKILGYFSLKNHPKIEFFLVSEISDPGVSMSAVRICLGEVLTSITMVFGFFLDSAWVFGGYNSNSIVLLRAGSAVGYSIFKIVSK